MASADSLDDSNDHVGIEDEKFEDWNDVIDGRILIACHYLPFKCTLVDGLPAGVPLLSPDRNHHLHRSSTSLSRFAASTSGSVTSGGGGGADASRSNVSSQFHSPPLSPPILAAPSVNGASSAESFDHSVPANSNGNQYSWKFTRRGDHSALYAGVLSLQDSHSCVFVGIVDKVFGVDDQVCLVGDLDDAARESLRERLWAEHQCVPVFVDSEVSSGHYEGFCKTSLWPLFHYIVWNPTDGRKERVYWDAYTQVNSLFSEAIVKTCHRGDTIWIHDYHLLLLPQMLREKLPQASIGFFLHTPFPSSEFFRCLPQRRDLLQGALGANLIGFQTYAYARHFISSCTRILGVESTPKGVDYKGNLVSIAIFPIGIDVQQVEKYRKSPGVAPKIAAIRELYADKKIIIGRDKLDKVKGVIHKLKAFDKFLKLYPEWQEKVVLIQVTSPTDRSFKLESKVSELVSRINGQYGSLGFAPVHHYHHHIDKDEYYALLTIADVALITAVRDGMNTTSHEYVMCQADNLGPLILSEFTGVAGSLSAAMLVNPWDTTGVANAINEALTMSREDKLTRHTQSHQYVTTHTTQFWAKSFIADLVNAKLGSDQSLPTPVLDRNAVISAFKKAKKKVFFLDYDGTLTQIRKTPGAAVPSDEILKALTVLAGAPNTYVYVISGRDQAALDEWLGSIENIGLSAEHGCFMRPVGSTDWENLSASIDLSWKADVLQIFEYYTERTPGSFIEHKRSSLTWHYRLADPQYGSWQAKECHNHMENALLSKLPIEILVGKKNLEVRPHAINKGEIIKRLLGESHLEDADFLFCAGDDKTDEDMFRALRKATFQVEDAACFTVTIGSAKKKTTASWHVPRTEDIIDMIGKLAGSEQQ